VSDRLPRLPPLRRILRSFGYAWRGLFTVATTQPNFVVHLIAAVLAFVAGAVLRLSPPEFGLIVLTVALVLSTEAMNTALESVCDLVQPTYHPLVKRAKDAAAAAVLIAAIASVLIAALLFVPHLR
jgi:diacylglycerol kinase